MAKASKARTIQRYGMEFPATWPDWRIELHCWNERRKTGLRPVDHFKQLLALTQPDVIWNPWSELRYQSLLDDSLADKIGGTIIRNISWVGPAASGKTSDAGIWASYWWLADMSNTCVALTTTSKSKMRQRVWVWIQQCYLNIIPLLEEIGFEPPKLLNSTMELRNVVGGQSDSRHAIFGQAVEEGETDRAVEKLKGVHAPRIALIVDEAPGTEEAIFQTIPNMAKGCSELVVISIGNGPLTHFDCFSRICRPVGGWKAVTVESERWSTTGVPEFQLPKGTCLHFDGAKSPNVQAGKTVYPFLYTWEDWQRVQRNPDVQRTAMFYSQDRGFWPPDGFLNTVLTEELIEQGNARGQVEFAGATKPIGSVDTGFGGDKCVLRFGRMGQLKDGKIAAQLEECITIPILVDLVDENGKKVPAEYQISDFIRREAPKRGVRAEYFGIEASGTGRGAAAVLTQEWGPVIVVESGGVPADRLASEEDERPAKEVYDRRITQLYFQVQAFVRGKQLGGLTETDCQQFCARLYDLPGKKYKLETKEELKPRLGHSPDEADSVCVFVEVCCHHGMRTVGPRGERIEKAFREIAKEQCQVYAEESMYQPEEV